MKTQFATTALIIACGLIAATPSYAQLTREQVKAELAAARISGDVMSSGERSIKLNELYPSRYPARQVPSALSREQVKAELAQAQRSGDYMADGEMTAMCKELHPNMHPVM